MLYWLSIAFLHKIKSFISEIENEWKKDCKKRKKFKLGKNFFFLIFIFQQANCNYTVNFRVKRKNCNTLSKIFRVIQKDMKTWIIYSANGPHTVQKLQHTRIKTLVKVSNWNSFRANQSYSEPFRNLFPNHSESFWTNPKSVVYLVWWETAKINPT